MDKNRANIAQIQKYLNGELDAKAMHLLEREAQDDPFLMDALEGYENSAGNHQPNLDVLKRQLNDRINKKERRIIPWTMVSIAAGVIGFMIVVGLLYKGNEETAKPLQTAQATELPAIKTDTVNVPNLTAPALNNVTTVQPRKKLSPSPGLKTDRNTEVTNIKQFGNQPSSAALAEVAVQPGAAVKSDGPPLDEMVIGAMLKQKDTVEMPLTVAIAKKPTSQPLISRAEGVEIIKDKKTSANTYELSKLNLPAGYLQGAVVNNQGAPMPGVSVKVDGKPILTQTDAKGRFVVPASSANETVDISYNGFETQRLSINSAGLNKVTLNSDSTSANSAAGSFSGKINTLMLAHPEKGWILYRLYLSRMSVLPVGEKSGIVELKFTVGPAGELTNIRVVKGLSNTTNKKAVSLIADGPKWVGNASGKPEEKTLQLEFTIK